MFRPGIGEENTILVEFDKWCRRCVYAAKCELDYPCDECLEHGASFSSERPYHFEPKEEDS